MSFSSKRNSLRAALALTALAAAALLAFAIIRGANQKESATEDSDGLKKFLENPKSLTPEEREELRAQWLRMSPESKSRIAMASMRKDLEKFRAETSKLNQEERLDRIRKELDRLRKSREKTTDKIREQAKQLLTEEDAKKLVKDGLDLFQKDLTPQERAELDPLAHEYVKQLNSVFQ